MNKNTTRAWIASRLGVGFDKLSLFIESHFKEYIAQSTEKKMSLADSVQYFHPELGIIVFGSQNIKVRGEIFRDCGYDSQGFKDFSLRKGIYTRDLPKILPLGFTYKRYCWRCESFDHFIIQEIKHHEKKIVNYLEVSANTDDYNSFTITSHDQLQGGFEDARDIPLGSESCQECRLLSPEDFDEFIKNHPNTLKQLKEKKGIERLVRLPEEDLGRY